MVFVTYKLNIVDKQLTIAGTKGPELCGNDDLYADLDMDEVDLNFENYEELFGIALHNSEELFENGGIDSLFGTTDMSGADSNCQGVAAAEVSSPLYVLHVANQISPFSNSPFCWPCILCQNGISILVMHIYDVRFLYKFAVFSKVCTFF